MGERDPSTEDDVKAPADVNKVLEEKIEEYERLLREKIQKEQGVLNMLLKTISSHSSTWKNLGSVVTNALVDVSKINREKLLNNVKDNLLLMIESGELPNMTEEQIDLILQVVDEGFNAYLTLLINAGADSIRRYIQWLPELPNQNQLDKAIAEFNGIVHAMAVLMARLDLVRGKCNELIKKIEEMYTKDTKFLILKALEESGRPLPAKDIVMLINYKVSEMAVRKHLRTLIRKGYVRRLQDSKNNYYLYEFVKAPWTELGGCDGEAE